MRECPKCGTCYADEVLFCQNHPAETKQTLPGTQLLAKRYFLEKRLGRGAMGQVYLARDENFGTRQVAVKTVRPDLLTSEDLQEGEAIARFEREARAAASIQHPHVVATTDFGKTEEGVFYLVMEYVKGETLHDLLRREGTLATKRALNLLQQIGDGVEAAHASGILHRDLKPANIFLLKTGRDDADGFIKVGDFGLAKIVDQAVSSVSAKQGPASRGIIGTPEFMAPEQMESEKPIDARADVYAIGTICYLMLGGRVPFTGDLMQIVTAKFTQDPPLLSRFRTDIAPAIEAAVMRALGRDPAQRPVTVSDWLTELSKAVRASSADDEENKSGGGRVVIMAPTGAEVYVDDERKGSIGSSGRMILASVPPGRHVLRVSRRGDRDDERLIEIREDSAEQVIQAVLKQEFGSQPSPSQGSQSGGAASPAESVPDVVVCTNCESRFAAGVRFCGRCGNANFRYLHPQDAAKAANNAIHASDMANANPTRFTVATNSGISAPTNFNCPRCNKMLPANARFCGGCGLNLAGFNASSISSNNYFNPNAARSVEVVCRNCRSTYPAGTKFCGRCGSAV
jgi:serine/threonine protein kinase